MKAIAILPAAGLSTRMGSAAAGERKPFLEFRGAPIFLHTLRQCDACPELERLILAVRPPDQPRVREALRVAGLRLPVDIVEGGETRQATVWAALRHAPAGTQWVVVHDAVRPLITPGLISRALAAAQQHAAVIAAVAAVDTVKQVEHAGPAQQARIVATLPRERIVLAQTPQVFGYDLLRRAFEKARADGFQGTDEASLVEHLGEPVFVIPGSARNLKITTPADLAWAERLWDAAE